MEGLIQRHGGVPRSYPALSEVPSESTPALTDAIHRLAIGRFDIVVLLTGAGTTHLFAASERQGLLHSVEVALKNAIVVARGPKPLAVLRQHDIRPAVRAEEPHTTELLIQALTQIPVEGRNVLIVSAGEEWTEPAATLSSRGAHVTQIETYRWSLSAENERALTRAIDDVVAGRIDAVAFTSQIQVRYLFDVADLHSNVAALRDALRNVVVGAVGPTCADTLRSYSVDARVVPDHPKMGHLVISLAAAIAGRADFVTLNP
jgi:uroporphyrinogen-III synthase